MKLDDMGIIKSIIETTEGMLARPNQAIWKQKGHENDFINYLLTVAFINSLESDTKRVGNEDLDDYEIFSPFEGLIIPNRVTIDGSDDAANLLSPTYRQFAGDDFQGYKVLNAQAFKRFTYALCAAFGKDKSTYSKKVNAMRTDQLLANVASRGVYDASSTVRERACFPLHLQVTGYESYSYQFPLIKAFERQLEIKLKEL